MEVPDTRLTPEQILKVRDAWFWYMKSWRITHYSLGFGGTICATAVAARVEILQGIPHLLDSLAWVSAASIGILTLFRPHGRANAYAIAWRTLNDATMRYALQPAYPVEDLLEAYTKGEQAIQSSDPTG